jgi:hypothetical protein
MSKSAKFVVNGFSRLLNSPEFRSKRQAIEDQVRAEYAMDMVGKPYWRRVAVRLAISREIRRRLREIAPSPHTFWSAR